MAFLFQNGQVLQSLHDSDGGQVGHGEGVAEVFFQPPYCLQERVRDILRLSAIFSCGYRLSRGSVWPGTSSSSQVLFPSSTSEGVVELLRRMVKEKNGREEDVGQSMRLLMCDIGPSSDILEMKQSLLL